jgi:hypothetical protein
MYIACQELDHANNKSIQKVICRVIDREPGQAAPGPWIQKGQQDLGL